MRLLTAGSLVRVQQGEPKEPDRSKDLSGSFTFPCYPRTNIPVANSRGCAATRRGDYAQLFCCDWKFSSTRPMFSQIAMFSTAETGSIGSGSDRDDHVSRRKGRWPCVREKAIEVKRIGQRPIRFLLLSLAILEQTFLCLTAARLCGDAPRRLRATFLL